MNAVDVKSAATKIRDDVDLLRAREAYALSHIEISCVTLFIRWVHTFVAVGPGLCAAGRRYPAQAPAGAARRRVRQAERLGAVGRQSQPTPPQLLELVVAGRACTRPDRDVWSRRSPDEAVCHI